MQLNVARLLKEPVGAQKTYTLNAYFGPSEEIHTDHLQGQLRLTRTDLGIWVSGGLEASARFTCSRCLQESNAPILFQMDEVYYPTVNVNTGVTLPLPEDGERHCIIDSQHVLDITEAVRQHTVLGLPMKPLCQEDCAGLCPQCGVNLGETVCSCEVPGMDPRWIPLIKSAFASRG